MCWEHVRSLYTQGKGLKTPEGLVLGSDEAVPRVVYVSADSFMVE